MTQLEAATKSVYDAMDITDKLDPVAAEKYARAVIEALREPNQAMFLAMERAGVSFATQERMWPAVVDAILADPDA